MSRLDVLMKEGAAKLKNHIKKDLYKSKAIAKLARYEEGNLYYDIELSSNEEGFSGGIYQFPISTIEFNTETYYEDIQEDLSLEADYQAIEVSLMSLSSDLGATAFEPEMKGSLLIRWIQKALDNNKFAKIA